MSRLVPALVLLISAAGQFLAATDAPPGLAPTGNGGGSSPGGQGSAMGGIWLMLPLFLLVMWFLVIRPQRKEEQKRKQVIANLKRGDRVVTIGGLHGEVAAVGETTVDIRAGVDGKEVVLRFTKGAVSASGESAEADAQKGK